MTRIRRTIMASLTAASLALCFAGGLIAASANETDGTKYEYRIGPNVASASNGDRLELTGRGTFVTGSDDVTGGGTFVHKNSAGEVLASGTWSADELISFIPFGGQAGLPPSFEGGLAKIEVRLRPTGSGGTVEAILRIDCAINSPTGMEGIQLAVEDGLNFNTEVSGQTLFVNLGKAED